MPPDAGARPPSIMLEVGSAGQSQLSEGEQVMVCVSCGRPGHGVNRSSGTRERLTPAGQSVFLGEIGRRGSCRWGMIIAPVGLRDASFSAIGEPSHRNTWAGLPRRNPIVPDSPIRMGGGSPSVVPPVSGARRSGRGMRPDGGNSQSPKKLNVMSE